MPHEPPDRIKHFFKFYGIEPADTPERADLLQYSEYRSGTNFIYLIRCGDYLKIGIAADLYERLSQLQIGNPLPIHLCCYFETANAIEDEKKLHRLFLRHHVRGEWFKLTEILFHSSLAKSGLGLTHKKPPKAHKVTASKIALRNLAVVDEFQALKSLGEKNKHEQVKNPVSHLILSGERKPRIKTPPAMPFVFFKVLNSEITLWAGKVGQLIPQGPQVIIQSRINDISIPHRLLVEQAIKEKQSDILLDEMHYCIVYGKQKRELTVKGRIQ